MSLKFGRDYMLSVMGRSGKFVDIMYPITCRFTVSHAAFSSANSARFQLVNLGAANQKEIYWDQWIKATAIPIVFYAGYQSTPNIPQIFTGYVTVAYTERSGQDLITYIEAMDGGYGIRNGVFTNFSIPANTPLPNAFVNAVTKGLPGVTTDLSNVVFTNPPPPLKREYYLNGSAWQEIHDKLLPKGAQCGIADGVAYAVGLNDYLPVGNNLGILNAATGLLDIPKREGSLVSCSCLFEPRMKLNQTLQLVSTRVPWVNGTYSIVGFTHQGTISGVESGEATTETTLFSTDAPNYPTIQGPTGPAANNPSGAVA